MTIAEIICIIACIVFCGACIGYIVKRRYVSAYACLVCGLGCGAIPLYVIVAAVRS